MPQSTLSTLIQPTLIRRTSIRNKLMRNARLAVIFCAGVLLLLLAQPAPAYAACGSATNVATEGQLNSAIAAFNSQTAACAFRITLTADILLDASTTPIDNARSGITLDINGNGYTVDAQNKDGVRPFTINTISTTVTIRNMTLTRGNLVNNPSGGVILNNGMLTVANSTFSNNRAVIGGGIRNAGILVVTNSTFSGNSALNFGGGIFNQGVLTVINSTFSGNSSNQGGGIHGGASLTVHNSILANSTGGDCWQGGALGDIRFTLIEDTGLNGCGFSAPVTPGQPDANGNIIGVDPLLDFLSNNGGRTMTMALRPGSPALDHGSNALAIDANGAALTTDQRGPGYPRVQNGTVDMGAVEWPLVCPAAQFDAGDPLALSNAIFCFNALTTAGAYTINLTSAIDLTESSRTINNSSPGVELLINGAGFNINGQQSAGVRPLTIASNSTVTIQDIAITGGNAADGGGIHNAGTLSVNRSTISGNNAGAAGGGIRNEGALTLTSSTVSGNSAGSGGGIRNNGTLTLNRSTFSDNSATIGGGIHSGSSLVVNSSIIANSTGGDCLRFGGIAVIQDSLIEATGDDGCGLTAPANPGEPDANGNIVGVDPQLDALADNGGPTPTHALLDGSPALDIIANFACSGADQRGVPRPQGTGCDLGAFERAAQALCSNGPLTVRNEAELNAAIDEFNRGLTACAFFITLAADIELTASTNTIGNATPDLNLTLDGSGFAVDGQGRTDVRPFAIQFATTVAIQNMTVTGGNAAAGGGIINGFGGMLTVGNSTIAANVAEFGGGIANSGTLALTNATVSGNQARFGGGIDNGAALTMTNSTVAGNRADSGGGIRNVATLTLRNSIIADSTGGDCVSNGGTVTANNVLIEDADAAACGLSAPSTNPDSNGNYIGVDPQLGPLADNGGLTETHLPGAGSPVINAMPAILVTAAGAAALASVCDGTVPNRDQRSVSRPQGNGCDLGAVELAPQESCNGSPANVGTEAELNAAIAAFNSQVNRCDFLIFLTSDIRVDTSPPTIDNRTANVTLTIDGAGFTLDGQQFTGVRPVTIDGTSPVAVRNITILGGGISGGFGGAIYNGGTLSVTDSTISDSIVQNGSGGAIFNAGTLTISNSTVARNQMFGFGSGGAIFNQGTLTVDNSGIADNLISRGDGGAIYNRGTLTVTNSTIANNAADDGGGGAIANAGTLTVSNSTITGNEARYGGGIFSYDTLTVTNSTFSHNSASYGGGILNDAGALTVINSTFTNNTGGGIDHNGEDSELVIVGSLDVTGSIMADNPGGDCAVWSGDVNIRYSLIKAIGSNACDLTDGVNGNIIGADPLLGLLADNGGSTQTHLLRTGSPAIDAIPTAIVNAADAQALNLVCNGLVPATDQIGTSRPQGTGCDMGSVESTTPLAVTLGWFLAVHAAGADNVVDFRWQTVSETGIAGFNLLAVTEEGKTSLNPTLIPSPVIDSLTPTDYAFSTATDATVFYLQEVGIDGGMTEHGPFELDQEYGSYSLPGNVELSERVWLPLIAAQ